MSIVFSPAGVGDSGGSGGGGGGATLVSIAIITPPAKTSYVAGESFNPAGMVVEATYSSGAKTVATGYNFIPSTGLPDGTTSVTIQYTEGGITVTAQQPVTVIHRLESIAVTTLPTKTSYEYQDTLNTVGMTVRAAYSDGTTANVTGWTCSPTTMRTIGSQIVTVTYTEGGYTRATTFDVTVARKTISAIPVQSDTLTYNGWALSPTWTGYIPAQLTLGGVTSGINAGSYEATFTPTENYRWSDGSITTKTATWEISKAPGSLTVFPPSIELTQDSPDQMFFVDRAGDGVISVESSASDVAAAEMATGGLGNADAFVVTGLATGEAVITVRVAEGTNYLAPPDKTCAVTVKFYANDFANNTWAEIAEACRKRAVPDSWVVGSSKTMAIGGREYQIDIIGKHHDDYADGSGKAPLTFQMHDCYADTKNMNSSNTNSGGWTSCDMRSTHLPAILTQMPSEVQAGIKEVNKLASAGSLSTTINTTADKLFLLSEVEVFGSNRNSASGEGSQYAYYSAGNSKVKNRSGSATNWWERSPAGSSSTSFCRVNYNAGAVNSNASSLFGVAFAFCF